MGNRTLHWRRFTNGKSGKSISLSAWISALIQLQQKNFSSVSRTMSASPRSNPQQSRVRRLLEGQAPKRYQAYVFRDHGKLLVKLGYLLLKMTLVTGLLIHITYLRSPYLLAWFKIDQSFTDMLTNPDDLRLFTGVMGLAKAFNREVIAEICKPLWHGRRTNCARLWVSAMRLVIWPDQWRQAMCLTWDQKMGSLMPSCSR